MKFTHNNTTVGEINLPVSRREGVPPSRPTTIPVIKTQQLREDTLLPPPVTRRGMERKDMFEIIRGGNTSCGNCGGFKTGF
jgi:hypothetical protein